MTVSFRSILGAKPSTPSTSDSVLIVIDAQNEYNFRSPYVNCFPNIVLTI